MQWTLRSGWRCTRCSSPFCPYRLACEFLGDKPPRRCFVWGRDRRLYGRHRSSTRKRSTFRKYASEQVVEYLYWQEVRAIASVWEMVNLLTVDQLTMDHLLPAVDSLLVHPTGNTPQLMNLVLWGKNRGICIMMKSNSESSIPDHRNSATQIFVHRKDGSQEVSSRNRRRWLKTAKKCCSMLKLWFSHHFFAEN